MADLDKPHYFVLKRFRGELEAQTRDVFAIALETLLEEYERSPELVRQRLERFRSTAPSEMTL